jgi:hypothetical protein
MVDCTMLVPMPVRERKVMDFTDVRVRVDAQSDQPDVAVDGYLAQGFRAKGFDQ